MKILSCWDSLGEDFNRQRSEEYLPEERRALFQAAKEAIPLLVRENTVMESNLREYDWALQLTLQELFRVRGDAIELTTLMKQATSIKRYLRAEHQAQQELQEEQMRLEARHEHLTALLHEATNAQDEERTTALIQALAHENSILRSMLFPSKEGEEPFVDSPRRALSSSRGSRSDRRTLSSPSPGKSKLGTDPLDEAVMCERKKEDWRVKKSDGPTTLLSSASRAKGRGLRWCVKAPNSDAVAADVQPAGNVTDEVIEHEMANSVKAWQDPVFRVGRRLLGPNGSNMKLIAAKTGCRLRLRGRGSWFLEGPYQQESTDPLMLCVSSPSEADHSQAIRLIEELLLSVYAEFRTFCKTEGWTVPDLRIRRNEGARKGAR
eukprot:g2532.t1